jgi:hypothetical protein
LIIEFIEILQLVTTRNYNAVANRRTLLLTTTHTKSFLFRFIGRFSVTVLSSVDYSTSAFTVSQLTHYSNRQLSTNYSSTGYSQTVIDFDSTGVLVMQLKVGLHRKRRIS